MTQKTQPTSAQRADVTLEADHGHGGVADTGVRRRWIIAGLVCIVGVAALVGWRFDLPLLTAIGFVAVGGILWLLLGGQRRLVNRAVQLVAVPRPLFATIQKGLQRYWQALA